MNANLSLTATNLHVTNLTNTFIDMAWDTNTNCPYLIKRLEGSPTGTVDFSATVASGTYTYHDTSAYTSGNTYCYQLFDNTNPSSPALLSQEVMRPYLANATDNQVVDSRLDLRRGQNVFLNHQFGSTTYRGGLYAGNADDNSVIGRSYLKFPLTAFPEGGTYRVGNVNAYFTGAYTTGGSATNVTVGCQAISDDTWLGSTLVWSSSLNVLPQNYSPSAALNATSVSYSLSNPTTGWVYWNLSDDILTTLEGDQVLSAVLASTDESNNGGWAYFAKKEYQGGSYTPCVTYAFDIPLLIKVTFDNNPFGYLVPNSGAFTPCTATIVINGIGPGDSAPVTITQSYSIGGQSTQTMQVSGLNRTFPVTVQDGGHDQSVTVTVSYAGVSLSYPITYKAQTSGM